MGPWGPAPRADYLISPGDQPALLVASGTLVETVTSAELGSGGFAAATGISFLGRLLADAPTGRRSAWTGSGTNRGAETTPDVSERTEIVSG